MNSDEILYRVMQLFDTDYKWSYNEHSIWEIDGALAEQIRLFVREKEIDDMMGWNQEDNFY
jgi:hypothetical protein